MCAAVDALEATIGYSFADRELLRRALTHSSHVHESTGKPGFTADNEQMEFLGDAVLGFLIREELVKRLPEWPEGDQSKVKAHLVSSTHLFEVAQTLELGRYLQLGRGEELSGGRAKKTLLANALEAVIAALYLDGGMPAARAFVVQFLIGPSPGEQRLLEQNRTLKLLDFKSALQELMQARRLPQPRYNVVREEGPEHAKVFTVEVRAGRDWADQAQGLSKKSA